MNLNPFRFFKKKVVERKIHILTNKAEKKALLRERVANVWFSMTNRERHKKSQLATGRLLHYLNLIEAKTVLFYASMEDEPSTDQILEIWMQDPKRTLVLTRVCNSTKQLDPYKVDSWEQLEMGRFRIRMPHKDCQQIDLTELDAVVVPGRLFDKNKNRIGRGYGFYDRFRNRIIVPIHDRQKRVIGFGGRSLDGSEPKYLNSPETEIFEKGKNLFGLDKSNLSIRKKDYAVVVEGYFDVMALHDSGITNVVASLGTALSRNQITLLSRATESKKILLNFDSDNAGIRAANRAISEVENLAIQGQLDLRILQLPSGKDPDEFLKDNSSSEYEALAAKSPLWMDWQIDQSLKDLDLSKSDQFQEAVGNLVSLLGKLPQTAIRTHYLQKVAQRLSGGHGRFALQLEEDLRNQISGQRWHGRSKKIDKPLEISLRERSEADILSTYIHCPNFRSFIRYELRLRELDDFAINHHRAIWSSINHIEENKFGSEIIENINRSNDPNNILADLDLIKNLLDNFLANDNEHLPKLTPLLEVNELRLATLSDPESLIRGALAALERQKSLKRCRHLIDAWSTQRLQTLENCIASLIVEENNQPDDSSDMEEKVINMFEDLNNDAINFQQLYYAERKHILNLDQQRCYK